MKCSGLAVFLWGGFFLTTTAAADYSGSGGMTRQDIRPDVYDYHYAQGFSGADAMGWDPNLQFTWSRVGAALSCGIGMNKTQIIENLSKRFGSDPFIHEFNGIGFHHLHSSGIDGFCTPDRVQEIRSLMPQFEAGEFPVIF